MTRQHSIVAHKANYFFRILEDDYLLMYQMLAEQLDPIKEQEDKKPSASSDCKAMIASILENWMNSKRPTAKCEEDLYVYLTYDEWVIELRGHYKRSTVIQCIKEMEEEGGYTDENGKEYQGTIIKHHYVQNTFMYLLNLPVVNAMIEALPEQSPFDAKPKVSLGRPSLNHSKLNHSKLNGIKINGLKTDFQSLKIDDGSLKTNGSTYITKITKTNIDYVSADADSTPASPPLFYSMLRIPMTYEDALIYLTPHGIAPLSKLAADDVVKLAQKLWNEAHEQEEDQEQAETWRTLQAGLIASGVIGEHDTEQLNNNPIATTDTQTTLLQAEQERENHATSTRTTNISSRASLATGGTDHLTNDLRGEPVSPTAPEKPTDTTTDEGTRHSNTQIGDSHNGYTYTTTPSLASHLQPVLPDNHHSGERGSTPTQEIGDSHNGHGGLRNHGTGDSGGGATLLPLVPADGSGSTTGTQPTQEVIPIGVDKSQANGDKSSKGKKPVVPTGPLVMPPDDAKWCAETAVQMIEARKGRRYGETTRKQELAKATEALRYEIDGKPITRAQFTRAWEQMESWPLWVEKHITPMIKHLVKDDRIVTLLQQKRKATSGAVRHGPEIEMIEYEGEMMTRDQAMARGYSDFDIYIGNGKAEREAMVAEAKKDPLFWEIINDGKKAG